MITIGDFSFPERTTIAQVSVIEAKSKVRKEIRIQSMLKGSLEPLRRAIEAFDRGDAALSLQAGRYYMGRRREFMAASNLPGGAAWVDFWVLTRDRYERSEALHAHVVEITTGQGDFSLFHLGNWTAPLCAVLHPSQTVEKIEITTAAEVFALEENIPAGGELIVDSETRQVFVDGENRRASAGLSFPHLTPGANAVTVQTRPAEAAATCTLQYRDRWV
ncbi:MAG: phage distal tail protein [Candidatus Hinthialibacter sp.]